MPPVTDGSRACHWVLKVGNLKASLAFFENVLGLRVLRHEEFLSGCEATCNGPYLGAWSKTMVGYGAELSNFALELTYNFGIGEYAFGNDLLFIALHCPAALSRARAFGFLIEEGNIIVGPDNYRFKIIPSIPNRAEMFVCVALRVASLAQSLHYWSDLLGLTHHFPSPPSGLFPSTASSHSCALVGFSSEQVQLLLVESEPGVALNHARSSGRIAFACKSVAPIFSAISSAGGSILTPPLTLHTAGKADVVVTILQDPDGYEICFVEETGFYALAVPVYDVVDFEDRARRGGDGAPPPWSLHARQVGST